jgi:hypothetical protein
MMGYGWLIWRFEGKEGRRSERDFELCWSLRYAILLDDLVYSTQL